MEKERMRIENPEGLKEQEQMEKEEKWKREMMEKINKGKKK